MKKISVIINFYHSKSRGRIDSICRKFFAGTAMINNIDPLFTCIDELVKNAIKANYKYVLITEEMKRRGIVCNDGNYTHHAPVIEQDSFITEKVRAVLDEESRRRSGHDRVDSTDIDEKDPAFPDHVMSYSDVWEKIRTGGVNTSLTMMYDDDIAVVRVANSAPMLANDLNRIHQKLSDFRKHREESREHEFFASNLDTSQGGFGFGYAIIDSCCAQMGVSSVEALSISTHPITSVELTIPACSDFAHPCDVEFIEVA